MLPRSFYFLRHGETDANVEKRLQGWLDIPLNENGRSQAMQAAHTLKHVPIDRIVASPLLRTRETAEIVNQVLQKPLMFEPAIRERNFGHYEGKTGDECRAWDRENKYENQPTEPETGFAVPPGGETYAQFRQRVLDGMSHYLNHYPDERILFIAHGRVFGALHLELIQCDLYSQNAQPYYFNRNNEAWQLDYVSNMVQNIS